MVFSKITFYFAGLWIYYIKKILRYLRTKVYPAMIPEFPWVRLQWQASGVKYVLRHTHEDKKD